MLFPVSFETFKKHTDYEEAYRRILFNEYAESLADKYRKLKQDDNVREAIAEKIYKHFYEKPEERENIGVKIKPCPRSIKALILQHGISENHTSKSDTVCLTPHSRNSPDASIQSIRRGEQRSEINQPTCDKDVTLNKTSNDVIDHAEKKCLSVCRKNVRVMRQQMEKVVFPVSLEEFKKYTNVDEVVKESCFPPNLTPEEKKELGDGLTLYLYFTFYAKWERRNTKLIKIYDCPENIQKVILTTATRKKPVEKTHENLHVENTPISDPKAKRSDDKIEKGTPLLQSSSEFEAAPLGEKKLSLGKRQRSLDQFIQTLPKKPKVISMEIIPVNKPAAVTIASTKDSNKPKKVEQKEHLSTELERLVAESNIEESFSEAYKDLKTVDYHFPEDELPVSFAEFCDCTKVMELANELAAKHENADQPVSVSRIARQIYVKFYTDTPRHKDAIYGDLKIRKGYYDQVTGKSRRLSARVKSKIQDELLQNGTTTPGKDQRSDESLDSNSTSELEAPSPKSPEPSNRSEAAVVEVAKAIRARRQSLRSWEKLSTSNQAGIVDATPQPQNSKIKNKTEHSAKSQATVDSGPQCVHNRETALKPNNKSKVGTRKNSDEKPNHHQPYRQCKKSSDLNEARKTIITEESIPAKPGIDVLKASEASHHLPLRKCKKSSVLKSAPKVTITDQPKAAVSPQGTEQNDRPTKHGNKDEIEFFKKLALGVSSDLQSFEKNESQATESSSPGEICVLKKQQVLCVDQPLPPIGESGHQHHRSNATTVRYKTNMTASPQKSPVKRIAATEIIKKPRVEVLKELKTNPSEVDDFLAMRIGYQSPQKCTRFSKPNSIIGTRGFPATQKVSRAGPQSAPKAEATSPLQVFSQSDVDMTSPNNKPTDFAHMVEIPLCNLNLNLSELLDTGHKSKSVAEKPSDPLPPRFEYIPTVTEPAAIDSGHNYTQLSTEMYEDAENPLSQPNIKKECKPLRHLQFIQNESGNGFSIESYCSEPIDIDDVAQEVDDVIQKMLNDVIGDKSSTTCPLSQTIFQTSSSEGSLMSLAQYQKLPSSWEEPEGSQQTEYILPDSMSIL